MSKVTITYTVPSPPSFPAKVGICKDEEYPVFSLTSANDGDCQVEVSEELWNEYTSAETAYATVQDKLRRLWNTGSGY